MKAIIIARVSTEEQKEANNSLPAQIHRLEQYCKKNSFEITKSFSFDESAYKDKRDDFDKILDQLIEYKDKIAVCFDKVDRLSRNIFDTRISALYEKALADSVELHFVSDGQIITSKLSAVEKFNFSISLGLAKYYSDAISDTVKRAHEQILRNGIYPSKPPFGYKRESINNEETAQKDKKSVIVIDEYASKIVHRTYELYATKAFSLDLLRKKINSDFGLNWSKGYIDKVLKDQFYCGFMTWNKKKPNQKIYPHKYPHIIDKTLFEQVQQIKAGFQKKPFKYAGKPYLYRGLLRCGHCGLSITPEKHKGHIYYHCTQYNGKHGAKWLTEDSITQQLGSVFKKLQVPKYILEQIVDTLKSTHESKSNFRELQFKDLTNQHEKYSKRIEQVYMDKLDGRITDDNYDKYYETFREKLSEIDTKLAMLQEADDNYYVTCNHLLELANRAYDLFVDSEVEEKRQLIKLVLQNLRVEDEIIRYEGIKPFDIILDSADHQLWLPG
ncbi:MAG: recombinase family protein [Patescibacteria group bacterium]